MNVKLVGMCVVFVWRGDCQQPARPHNTTNLPQKFHLSRFIHMLNRLKRDYHVKTGVWEWDLCDTALNISETPIRASVQSSAGLNSGAVDINSGHHVRRLRK